MLNMRSQNWWTEKLTFSLHPKKSRFFLPHTEPLAFEKPGAGVDLTFIACFILIPGAVRCSQPRANIFRWVNCTHYYPFIEAWNSREPSLSSIMAIIIRPTSTDSEIRGRCEQTRKNVPVCCTTPLISFTWMFVSTRSLLLKRSFREAQSFWHVSMRDFKSAVMILIIRSEKQLLDLKF